MHTFSRATSRALAMLLVVPGLALSLGTAPTASAAEPTSTGTSGDDSLRSSAPAAGFAAADPTTLAVDSIIRGTVQDTFGDPLDGMTVEAVPAADPSHAPLGSAITYEVEGLAEHGAFQLDVPAGDYLIRVSDGSDDGPYYDTTFYGSPTTVTATAGTPLILPAPVTLPMINPGSASGSVLDPGGDPLGDMDVELFRRYASGWVNVDSAWTSSDGTYEFHGLRPGRDYTVAVFPSWSGNSDLDDYPTIFLGGVNAAESATTVRVTSDEEKTLAALTLAAGVETSGTLATLSGDPLTYYHGITYFPVVDGVVSSVRAASTYLDEVDGNSVAVPTRSLLPGTYTVRLTSDSSSGIPIWLGDTNSARTAATFTVSAPGPVDFGTIHEDAPHGTVSVHLVDGQGTTLTEDDAYVSALIRSGDGWEYVGSGHDQGGGNFTLSVPFDEPFILVAAGNDGSASYYLGEDGTTTSRTAAKLLQVEAGSGTLQAGTITLWADRGIVTVHVEDTDHQPVSSDETWMNAYRYDPAEERWRQVVAGSPQGDGSWTFRLRYDALYTLGTFNYASGEVMFLGGTSDPTDPSTQTFTLSPGQAPYDAGTITLPKSTKLRVALVDSAGDALTQGYYELSLLRRFDDGDGAYWDSVAWGYVDPEDDGGNAYTFHVDPAGDYAVEISSYDQFTSTTGYIADDGPVESLDDATVFRVPAGETMTVTSTTPRPRSFQGSLTDGTEPIDGAYVALYGSDDPACGPESEPAECGWSEWVDGTSTQADGSFVLSPNGSAFTWYWVQADQPKPGFEAARSTAVAPPAAGESVDVGTIVATPGEHALVGEVALPEGVSASSGQLTVSLYTWSEFGTWDSVDTWYSSTNRYGFTNLVPGQTYAVQARFNDWDTGVQYPAAWSGTTGLRPADGTAAGAFVYDGETNPADGPTVQIRPGVKLKGKLRNADGSACQDCYLTVMPEGDGYADASYAYTSGTGGFSVLVLPGARYSVYASDQNWDSATFGPWQVNGALDVGTLTFDNGEVLPDLTPLDGPTLSSTTPEVGDTLSIDAQWPSDTTASYVWRWYDSSWNEHTVTGTTFPVPAAAAGRAVSVSVHAEKPGHTDYETTLTTGTVTDPSVPHATVTFTVTSNPGGVPVDEGYVTAYDSETWASVSGTTDSAGQVALELVQGRTYEVYAYTSDWAHSTHVTQVAPSTSSGTSAIAITIPPPPPGNVSVGGPGVVDDGGGVSQPTINWSQTTTLTLTGCPTTVDGQQARWTMTFVDEPNEPRTGTFASSTSGGVTTYTATIPAVYPAHGEVVMTTNVTSECGAAPTTFTLYIDPSGVVVDQFGRPIAGADVVLSSLPDADGTATGGVGTYTDVPDGSTQMSPDNRTNPDTTDGDGMFRWDVEDGYYYKVRASAAGCTPDSTPPLYVGSPAVDLTIELTCVSGAHSVSPTATVDYTGSPKVGTLLTAGDHWASAGIGSDYTLSYEWRVKHGSAPATVVGTAATYTPTPADAGGTLTLTETARRTPYQGGNAAPVTFTSTSPVTSSGATVANGTQGSITQSAKPTGSGKVGTNLTAPAAKPAGAREGTTFTWHWAVNGTKAAGTDGDDTYPVAAADLGLPITVVYAATLAGYDTVSAISSAAATAVVGDAPTATATLTGSGKVGELLTAAVGPWSPVGGGSPSIVWRSADGVTPTVIQTGGTTYTVKSTDIGRTITATFTTVLAGHTDGTATTNGITAVIGDAPTALTKPVLQGAPVVGRTLTVTPGTWSRTGSPTYSWTRNGVPIGGATGSTYTVGVADIGALIAATVTQHVGGYADGTASTTGVRIAKVAPTVSAKLAAAKAKAKKGVLTVVVTTGAGLPRTGTITVRDKSKVVATVAVPASGVVRIVLVKVKKKGSHPLTVTYSGNSSVLPATAKPVTLKVK